MPFAVPETTFVPIKQIVSKSVMLSISSKESDVSDVFLTLSDSPVKEDWLT